MKEGCVKFNNKKGFTLAELLIVLAITTVLLAITMVGLLHYANVLKLTEMDNTSKEIFISAQNHLTQAEVDGALSEYVKDNSGDASRIGSKITVKPSDMSSDEWDKNKDNYYYINYSQGSSTSLSDSILSLILPFGAIDEQIRKDGNYIIEYNIKTATIYGVFFDDRFSMKNEAAGTDDEVAGYLNNGIRNNDDTGRSARMHYSGTGSSGNYFVIGYYGGAMVDVLGIKITQPEITVDNGDKLQVTVTDPNYYTSAGGVQLKTYVTLKVTGRESGNSRTFVLKLSDASSTPEKESAGETYWSVSSDGKTVTYKVDLDDITTSGGHFAELCRNMIPGEDITVTASCSSNEVLTQVVKSRTVMTNSLFANIRPDLNADGKTASGTATAEISCIRHLENLDPSVSALPQAKLTSPATGTGDEQTKINAYYVNSASITADIDYDDFVSKVGSSFSIYKYRDSDTAAAQVLSAGGYYGIRNDKITSYNGNDHVISKVTINNKNTPTSGIADNGNGALLRYVGAGDASGKFTIRNMILKDFDVYSYKNAAALIAESNQNTSLQVSISKVLVWGGTISSTAATGNSSPLISYCKIKALNVSDCGATTHVSSTYGDAGGLIGEIGGTAATVQDCYAGGYTSNGKYSTSDFNVVSEATGTTSSSNNNTEKNDHPAAGGFIGKIGSGGSVTLDSCYSTCSARGSNAGGFAGYIYSSARTIKNCYATGLVQGDSTAGTFIGKAENSVSLTGDNYLNGINDTSMYSVNNSTAVTGVDADGAIAETGSGRETYPNDTALAGSAYPFRMVSTAGAAASGSYAHYGDWPRTSGLTISEGDFTFAYREGTKGSYKWYLKSYSLDSSGDIQTRTFRNLESRSGQYIGNTEPCYGMLLTAAESAKVNSYFKGNTAKSYFDLSSPETVTVEGKTMYFYRLKSSVSGIETLPQWYLGQGKGSQAVAIGVSFNTYFAAAITKDGESALGTKSVPYEVRTQAQLERVDSYPSSYFVQSCDIRLPGTYSAPVVNATFTGTYDAAGGSDGYSITGANMSISTGEYVGLFKINKGTIKGVTLTDSSFNVNDGATPFFVGTLAAVNEGTLDSCRVTNTVKLTLDSLTMNKDNQELILTNHKDIYGSYGSEDVDYERISMVVGGLTGRNYNNGVIDSCSSDARITSVLRSNSYSYSGYNVCIGGLVGIADNSYDQSPEITASASGAVISSDYYCNNYNSSHYYSAYIGGLAGYMVGSTADLCSSTATIDNTSTNAAIGGLAGVTRTFYFAADGADPSYVTASRISRSYARTTITNKKYSGTSEKPYIGGFVGDAHYAGSVTSAPYFTNCYAAVDYKNSDSSYGLFAGYSGSDRNISCCHGIEMNGTAVRQYTDDYKYFNGDNSSLAAGSACYACAYGYKWYLSGTTGVSYVTSLTKYGDLATFSGWDTGVWTVKSGAYYPTLIKNPEK